MAATTKSFADWQSERLLKVTIPAFQLADCPDSDRLAGEYILERGAIRDGMMFWSVRFPAVCGYRVMQALVHPDELGRPLLKVWLGGSNNYAQWGVGDGNNPDDPPVTLDFERATAHAADWPRNITLEFLPLQNAPAGAPASALLMDAPNCFCLSEPPVDFRLENLLFDVGGLWSGTCCTGYPSTIPLAVYTPDDCYWVGDVPYPGGGCGSASQGATLYMGEQDPCLWWADIWLISFNGSNYSTAIFTHVFRLDEFSPDGPLTCPIDNIIADGCTMNAGFTLNIYPAPPEVDIGAEGECELRNLPGCCRPMVIPPPNPNNPSQVLDIVCCPCLPPPPVPGPGGGCSGSDCALGVNATNGQVYLTVGNDFGGVNMTPNEPGAATAGAFGTNAMTLIEEHITTGSSSTEVHKCDGRVLVFACRNTSGSPITDGPWPLPVNEYIPIPPNNDRLYWTGTSWVLTQGFDGAKYHYGAGNKLALIQKKFGNVTQTWTFSNNAVIEPSGLRTTYTFNGSGKVRRMTDPYGRITTLTVDGSGNLTQRITPELCTTTMRYDGSKRLVAQIDCYGNRTSLAYDADSKVKRATTPTGGIYTYTYPTSGVTKIVEPGTAVTTVLYNRWGTIQKIVSPAGLRITYAYANEFRTVDISPAGVRTSYTYQRLNDKTLRLRSTITPAGRVTNVYDSSSRLAAVVNALGGRTTYVYSGTAKLAEINPLGFRTSYVYNAGGLLAAVIDPLSHRTTYLYNALKQKSANIDPLGNRTTFLYANGMPLVTIDPLGRRTTTNYDASDRLVATIQPNGTRTTNVYDAGQRKLATINPAGYRTSNVYDKNNLVANIDPFSQRTTYAYDLRGNKKRTVDALSRITTTLYDTSNRPVAQITPLLARTTTVYNTKGQAAATINPLGFRTTNVYDTSGRNVSQINPLGFRATTVFGAAGLTVAQVDQLGNRSTNVYDISLRQVATVDPLTRRTTSVFDAAGRTVAGISPLNLRTTTVYDAANRSIAQITPLGFRSTTIYNSAGQTIGQKNPLGRSTTTVYDTAGQPVASINPLLNRTTTVYDATGRTAATIDPLGFRTTTVYNESRTVGSINARGYRTTTVYDVLGRQVATVDELGNRTTTAYDAGGRQVQQVNPLGNITTTVYNIASQLIATINPLGFRTSFAYDAAGRQVRSTDPLSRVTTSVFDKTGRVIATRNPLNERTTTVYDAAGQQVATINPLVFRSTTVYDVGGRTIEQITPLGFVTTTVYDNDSRTIATINPLGFRSTTVYDPAGQSIRQVDPLSRITTTSYDPAGQPRAVTNPANETGTTVYDAAGRAVATIDPLLRRATTVYDPVGNAIEQINPLNEISTTVYDPVNRSVASIDANAHRSTSVYDAAGQNIATVNALGYRTSNVYDAAGRMAALVDARAYRTTTVFDAANQARAQVNPLLQRVTSAYDLAGRRTLRIDARGNRTTYAYDAAGRLTRRRYPDAARTTWTYDSQDNPLVIAAAHGAFTRTYDPLDRVKQLLWPSGDVYTWTYDAAGQRRSRLASDIPGITTYSYDAAGRMSVLVNEHNEVTSYVYNKAGEEIRKLLDNGVRVTTTYDGASRTKSVRNYDSTHAVISLYTYTYDPAGNRIAEIAHDGDRVTFSYDHANQLTAEDRGETGGLTWAALTPNDWDALTADGWSELGTVGGDRQHVYDPAGNRTLEIVNGERTTFAYDSANRLRYSEAFAGRTTYTFDADGNQMTAEEPAGDITTNTWTYENQLTQVELPDDSVITYTYAPVTRDSTELRLSREDDAGTVNYVYDVNNLIRELDETYNVEREYTLNPMPYGDLVSQQQNGDSYFHLFDVLGSTRQLTDDTQTETDNYDFSAYGTTLRHTGTADNHAQWIGELGYRLDPATLRYLMSVREYSDLIARFVREDPARSDPNLYTYVKNRPAVGTDPSGLESVFLIHLTSVEGAVGIVETGIREGASGLIWMTDSDGLESTGRRHQPIQMQYRVTPANAPEVPSSVLKQLADTARQEQYAAGATNETFDGRLFGERKFQLLNEWLAKQKDAVYKHRPKGGGVHYSFKPNGWNASKPVLMEISGQGADKAVARLGIRLAQGADEAAATAAGLKWKARVKVAASVGGKVLVVVGAGASIYSIYTAESKVRQITIELGTWASAWAGAQGGACIGAKAFAATAAFAGFAGPQAAAPEEIITIPVCGTVGGVLGGIGGALSGAFFGRTCTEAVVDWVFPPGLPVIASDDGVVVETVFFDWKD